MSNPLPDVEYRALFSEEHSQQAQCREHSKDPGDGINAKIMEYQHSCEHQDAAHVLTG